MGIHPTVDQMARGESLSAAVPTGVAPIYYQGDLARCREMERNCGELEGAAGAEGTLAARWSPEAEAVAL